MEAGEERLNVTRSGGEGAEGSRGGPLTDYARSSSSADWKVSLPLADFRKEIQDVKTQKARCSTRNTGLFFLKNINILDKGYYL